MTRDDIINFAISAGFHFFDAGHAPMLHTIKANYSEEYFKRFAHLVAAAERAKLYALPGAQPAPSVPDVDALAQFIREVDGKHQLGAGALAERIVEWLAAAPEAKP